MGAAIHGKHFKGTTHPIYRGVMFASFADMFFEVVQS